MPEAEQAGGTEHGPRKATSSSSTVPNGMRSSAGHSNRPKPGEADPAVVEQGAQGGHGHRARRLGGRARAGSVSRSSGSFPFWQRSSPAFQRSTSRQPGHTLLDYGKHARLIVVGTRGRGGFAGVLTGSISHSVAQQVPGRGRPLRRLH